ncbi:SDR family NAD(P)-dependent oxidoreductase [Henriciella sp.]|uniref:SDR family NAD(P)-dependent oxidoreductase n=1 Tax=Henriciella sp. TaxID=1968823 RepID=UPI002628BB4E|nr:SDR family oxidoreductase [Henriciella sp.]
MTDQKTVIVTGAGSGIGAATARRFSADGWNIVLNGRTRSKLDKVAADLPDAHTLVVEGDVSKPADAKRIVDETASRFRGLDCLVNNAGVAKMGRAGHLSREDFETVMSVNVTGVYNMVTEALPHLEASQGSVVNVSSVSGIGGDWLMFGYNTAKGAVSNMTRAMALDLGQARVRTNAVAPSLTVTDMSTGVVENESLLAKFRERIPMGRPAEPEEVANVIAFLAGPDAAFVNGVVLPVDGGLSASNGQPNFGA